MNDKNKKRKFNDELAQIFKILEKKKKTEEGEEKKEIKKEKIKVPVEVDGVFLPIGPNPNRANVEIPKIPKKEFSSNFVASSSRDEYLKQKEEKLKEKEKIKEKDKDKLQNRSFKPSVLIKKN
jgi:hypothetical protein